MTYKNLAEALQNIGHYNQENIEKNIYEVSKNKTRVVISGTKKRTEITAIILHVLKFHKIETDFIFGENYNNAHLTSKNDFIIIEGRPSANIENLHANIALISEIHETEDAEIYKNFINRITSGGVLVYNEENTILAHLAENSENYFRKFPYKKPIIENKNNIFYLETELGNIPLQITDAELVYQLEGARYICQQLGILEENFYEALLNF